MTVLFTKCPYCRSQFMLLNTEDGKAECIICGKTREYDQQEISEAETRRDSLSEAYMGRMEKAFKAKDYEAMAKISDEVAKEGISSWYAWFCIGWSDLHEGKTGNAFDDFRLAVSFLDEENFDEFYELVMEAVLDSIESAAKENREWSTEETTIVAFAGALSERFDHLMEDNDFVGDLVLRMGTLSDSVDTLLTGAHLINETMMTVMDYMSGNTFVPDQQAVLRNALVTIESIDDAMQKIGNDGTFPIQSAKVLGKEYIGFIGMFIEIGDAMEEQYSEDELFALCDYWADNDYQEVFDKLQDAFEFHVGFMTSNGRNKGIMKKRDKAIQEYEELYKRPLVEGLVSPEQDDGDVEFDRICPECGSYLKADDEGLLVCECGFRSRIITQAIDSLPDKMAELVPMGRKAYESRDSERMNNIGEKALAIDENNWFGHFMLGLSCIVDGEIGEAVMLFAQAAENVKEQDAKELHDVLVDELGKAFAEIDDPDQSAVIVMVPLLFESVEMGGAKNTDLILHIVEKMVGGDYRRSNRGFMATMIINPTITASFLHNTGLSRQKTVCETLVKLLDSIEAGTRSIKKDQDGLRDDVLTITQTDRDLFNYLIKEIDASTKDMDAERKGYLAGYWGANIDEYEDIIDNVVQAFCFDDDVVYNPKSNTILKSKFAIRTYLDLYLKVADD